MVVQLGNKRYGATDVRLTTFGVKEKEREGEATKPLWGKSIASARVVFGSRQHASRGRVWAQMTRNKSNARRYTPPLLRTPFFSPYEAGTVLSAVAGRFPLGSRQSISGIRNAPARARKSLPPSSIRNYFAIRRNEGMIRIVRITPARYL